MQYLRLVGWALLLVGLIATPLFAGNTERVSIAGPAHTGGGTSRVPAITADARYVAFDSAAADLAPRDGNASIDVFIYDRTTGQMELVSATTSDTSGNGESRMPSVSAYGRYVVFHSLATDLVTGDSNGVADCFLRDRQSGYTTRISVSSADVQGNGVSGTPQISADGRYVAFTSLATNLVGGDTNAVADIFVRDTQASVTTRVSLGASDAEANGLSSQPTVSGDGRYIAFYSTATNLVSGDSNGYADVFVRDTQTGITSRVSVATGGAQATGGASNAPALSTDGRWVAFVSSATNLVSGDTNGVADVFLRDLQTGTTTRVSVDSSGMQAGGASSVPSLSADGRYVTFTSTATNLVSGDANGYADVFVHDCQTGATWRASVTGAGGEATGGDSSTSAISADGGVVAFSSEAANLAVLDGNAVDDIFVRETASGETTTVSLARAEGDANSAYGVISAGGRYVAFVSSATNLVADDTNGLIDVFRRDRETGETVRVNVDSDGAQAVGGDSPVAPTISADGRYVAFSSLATNLVPDDTNGRLDTFVHDCTTGETTRVSVATGGGESAGPTTAMYVYTLGLSGDGRYVAFSSDAADLVADDTNATWDVFLHDRVTVETTRVNLTSGGAQATGGMSGLPSLSADARYVAFASEATNLASGDTNESTDVFLRDRQTGTTTLVDVDSEGVQAASGASLPAVSADGRFVAFISSAANLVAGDTNGYVDVFVRDVVLGTTERVSVATGGAQADAGSLWLALSADGRRVAFASEATNLVADDDNGAQDAFLHDRATGVTTRVSVATDGSQATGDSSWVSLSADGRYVAFDSAAPDLVADDANGKSDIFVRERVTASFSGDPLAGIVPVTTAFTDLSTGGPTAWEWDFGDHIASSLQNPSHQYTSPNRYTVALTVFDEVDQDTAFEERYVRVSFTDVPLDQWAVNSILACVEAGIVTGYADLTYQPANAVTRDQMAVYIARALAEGDANVPAVAHAATFADVPSDYWAFKYVEYCYGASVVTGYWDGYHPTEIVNRAQMAVYVARSIVAPTGEGGLTSYTPPTTASFPDVATDYWAYKHIEYCKAQGIVSGYWDGYHPADTVTRDQMAVYVARAFGLAM